MFSLTPLAHKRVSDFFNVLVEKQCLFGITDIQYSDCKRNLTADSAKKLFLYYNFKLLKPYYYY